MGWPQPCPGHAFHRALCHRDYATLRLCPDSLSRRERVRAYKGRFFPKRLFYNRYSYKESMPWASRQTRSPTPPPSGGREKPATRFLGGLSVKKISPSKE